MIQIKFLELKYNNYTTRIRINCRLRLKFLNCFSMELVELSVIDRPRPITSSALAVTVLPFINWVFDKAGRVCEKEFELAVGRPGDGLINNISKKQEKGSERSFSIQ